MVIITTTISPLRSQTIASPVYPMFRTVLIVVLSILAFSTTALAQPVCRGKPFTARATASGTIYNRSSAGAIIRSAQRQLTRKWRAVAQKRYGIEYGKVKNGVCECTVNTRSWRPGTRLRVTCVGTAAACRVGQFYPNRVRCKISSRR